MPTRKGFTRFNEDTRVKIPATLHFCVLVINTSR